MRVFLIGLALLSSVASAQPLEIAPVGAPNYWMFLSAANWFPEINPPAHNPDRLFGGLYSLTGVHIPNAQGTAEHFFLYAGSGSINAGTAPGSECTGEQTMIFRTGYNNPGLRGFNNETYHGLATPCQVNPTYAAASMMPGGALVDENRGQLGSSGPSPKVFLTMEATWNSAQPQGFHRILLGYSPNGVSFDHLMMIRIDDSQTDWGLHAPHCQVDPDRNDRWFCYANVVGTASTARFDVIWDQPAPYYGRVRFCMDSACTPGNMMSYRMHGPLGGLEGIGDKIFVRPHLFRSDGFNIQGLQEIDGEFVAYGIRATTHGIGAPPCNTSLFGTNVSSNQQITQARAYEIVLFRTDRAWSHGPDRILGSNIRSFPGWGNTASSFPFIFEGNTGINYMMSTTQDDTICALRYFGWIGQRGSVVTTQLSSSLGL